MKKIALLISLSLPLCSCMQRKNLSPMPSISEQAKRDMARPVDCRNAQRDIVILESEKASVGKQMLSGVRSVMPIAAAVGILLGDYRDRVKVATGKYDRDLDAKIQDIRTTCRLTNSPRT